MSAADRKRRYRAHQRQGLIVLQVPVDPVNLAAVLVAGRYLSPAAEDDREALARAAAKVLANLTPTTLT